MRVRATTKSLRTLTVTSLAVALLSGCGADWVGRLFDAGHSSYTTDSGVTASNVSTLKQNWRLAAPACNGVSSGLGWFATPVTFAGVIYIGSNYGCLHAIRESDGFVLWSKFMGYAPKQTCSMPLGIVSSVVVQDDGSGHPLLYFHSPDGYLYKLKGGDGSVIWRTVVQIPSPTKNDVYAWSSPTVANGKVVIGVSSNCDKPFVQGQVREYDATNGHLLWTHNTIPNGFVGAGDWYDAAVDAAGDVYATTGSASDSTGTAHPNTTDGFEQGSLLKLNGTTGKLIWKQPAPMQTGDADYASSPILFTDGTNELVGATHKDGWFRVYRRDSGALVWQAMVGTRSATGGGSSSVSGGGVFDGTHLFVVSNATNTGGTWAQFPAGVWSPQNGTAAPGSVRQLDTATGALVSVGGKPFELPLPSTILGPASLNGNGLLVAPGGKLFVSATSHENGLFVIDTTKPPAVLRHLEDTGNAGEFSQPAQENGAILGANTIALVKWGQ
jgi:outer membrane protein assembly factor BamB